MSSARIMKRAAQRAMPVLRAVPCHPQMEVSAPDALQGNVREYPELRAKLVDVLLNDELCVERFTGSQQKAIQAALEDTPALPTAKRATRSQLATALLEEDLPLSAMQRDRAAIADTLIEDDVRMTSKASRAAVQRAMLEDDLTERTMVRAATNALLEDDFRTARPKRADVKKALLDDYTPSVPVSSFGDVMAADDCLFIEKMKTNKAATAEKVSRAMLEDTLTEETACAMRHRHNVAEAMLKDSHKLQTLPRQAKQECFTPFAFDMECFTHHEMRRDAMSRTQLA